MYSICIVITLLSLEFFVYPVEGFVSGVVGCEDRRDLERIVKGWKQYHFTPSTQ